MSKTLVTTRTMCAAVLAASGIFISVMLLGVVLAWWPARATEPPPPQQYTVTVAIDDGGSCTKVRVQEEGGTWTEWSHGPIQQTYDSGTRVVVETTKECPCAYFFMKWVSEEADDLDGAVHDQDAFTLRMNTTATAWYHDIVLPDQESTEWKAHYTQNPHIGDDYDHRVSLSSDPQHSFEGLTINEDFLKEEMIANGWTLSTDKKEQFQVAWNDDWDIISNNYRDVADRHAISPQVLPWAGMHDGDTFQILQRMRVKLGCISEDFAGPWFATHTIIYKRTHVNGIEIYVKKSGVQGPGDQQI